jgi:hypothetical protein
MYGWLWRHLPGPLVARVLQAGLLLAVAVVLLFLFVFPAVEPLLPYSDVTVGGGVSTPAPDRSPSPTPTRP